MNDLANEALKSIQQQKAKLDQRESMLEIREKDLNDQTSKFKEISASRDKRMQEREQAIDRKREELDAREKKLDEQEKSLGVKAAQIHSEALDAFNEKFVECQAKYYQRYKDLEQQYEGQFDQYTQAREEQLASLQRQYLERNEQFRSDYVALVAEFQKNVQEEAARAAQHRAEVLDGLQLEFREQAEKYQKDFIERLAGMEGSHQEKVKNLQSTYDSFYESFQKDLQERQASIAKRFAEAEKKREEEYLDRQETLQKDLQQRLDAIQKSMEERFATSLQEEAERRQQAWQEHQENLKKSFEENEEANRRLTEELLKRHQELVEREAEVDKQLQTNTEQESALQVREQMLETKKQILDERLNNIEEEVQNKIADQRASWEAERESLMQEIERLNDIRNETREKMAICQEVELRLDGKSLPEALAQLKAEKEETMRGLNAFNKADEERSKQAEQRYRDTKAELDRLQKEYEELSQKRDRDRSTVLQSNAAVLEQTRLAQEIQSLKQQLEVQTNTAKMYYEELKRYTNRYDKEQERNARIAILEEPLDQEPHERLPLDVGNPNQELQWLKNIEEQCKKVEFQVNRRILYAFHTALKTAEWSPLAVLAGVSGTGKSELPRLYSAFGGIQYHMVSVQPNWDSQESMLGFFNSIDNKFDAQPVLRFLVQAQKEKAPGTPFGLKDCMNLVLLDEMNLAYVELYFAEFLSKLELRRGMKENVKLEVKIGAGEDTYPLELSRNVLWTGTMNQDETTKTLSDKVLDRSFVINFPRPQKLVSRSKLPELTPASDLLTYSTWDSWCVKEIFFTDEEIRPFKEKVERINGEMGAVGRAIGHRVWQSMEYYMANYPQVRSEDPQEHQDAMNRAFEDQVVQKIMPKLRGIENRGQGKTCLQNIQGILNEDEVTRGLVNDFQKSYESGYGQFIWNSAEYLQKSEGE